MATAYKKNFEFDCDYKVLILRHKQVLQSTQDLFQKVGLQSILCPIYKIQRVNYELPADILGRNLIITSTSVFSVLSPDEIRALSNAKKVLVVGEKTKHACLQYGFTNVAFTGRNSAEILDYFQNQCDKGQTWFHIRGKVSNFDYEPLKLIGLNVYPLCIYELIFHKNIDEILMPIFSQHQKLLIPLYSAQMVRHISPFFQKLKSPQSIVLVALSGRIYDMLTDLHCQKMICNLNNEQTLKKDLHNLGIFRHH